MSFFSFHLFIPSFFIPFFLFLFLWFLSLELISFFHFCLFLYFCFILIFILFFFLYFLILFYFILFLFYPFLLSFFPLFFHSFTFALVYSPIIWHLLPLKPCLYFTTRTPAAFLLHSFIPSSITSTFSCCCCCISLALLSLRSCLVSHLLPSCLAFLGFSCILYFSLFNYLFIIISFYIYFIHFYPPTGSFPFCLASSFHFRLLFPSKRPLCASLLRYSFHYFHFCLHLFCTVFLLPRFPLHSFIVTSFILFLLHYSSNKPIHFAHFPPFFPISSLSSASSRCPGTSTPARPQPSTRYAPCLPRPRAKSIQNPILKPFKWNISFLKYKN